MTSLFPSTGQTQGQFVTLGDVAAATASNAVSIPSTQELSVLGARAIVEQIGSLP